MSSPDSLAVTLPALIPIVLSQTAVVKFVLFANAVIAADVSVVRNTTNFERTFSEKLFTIYIPSSDPSKRTTGLLLITPVTTNGLAFTVF